MPEITPVLQRLVDTLNDEDLFRCVIRGWALVEDAFDEHISGLLAEPMSGMAGTPFKHKLSLAIGLGILIPKHRKPFLALAAIRNDLAHGNREAEEIPATELEEIAHQLAAPKVWETLQAAQRKPLPALAWSKIALGLAHSVVAGGGGLARETRERERAALRCELDRQAGMTPLLRAVLSDEKG